MTTVARSRSTDRRYYGVAEGIVTAVEDPDKLGRVKVKFPWFDDESVSEWCRVCQFYAGADFGAFFLPEEGMEVLVAFIHGDMRLPIVLGGLYNGEDTPHTHRAEDKDEKLIRTKGGHEVWLVDTAGEEKILVRTQGGHELLLDDKNKIVSLTDDGGEHKVVLNGNDGSVTIETSGTLVLKGNDVEITAAGGMKIEAGETMDVSAATINLN